MAGNKWRPYATLICHHCPDAFPPKAHECTCIRLSVHESRADAPLANQICNRAVLQASRERVGPARTPLSPAAPSELRRVALCGDEVGRGARHRARAPPAHGSKANSPPVACLRRPAFLSVFSVSSWASESSTNAGHRPRGTQRGSLSDGRLGPRSAGARLDASHGKQRGTPPATCRWPARSPVGQPPPKRVRRVLAKRTVARAPSHRGVDVRPSSGFRRFSPAAKSAFRSALSTRAPLFLFCRALVRSPRARATSATPHTAPHARARGAGSRARARAVARRGCGEAGEPCAPPPSGRLGGHRRRRQRCRPHRRGAPPVRPHRRARENKCGTAHPTLRWAPISRRCTRGTG